MKILILSALLVFVTPILFGQQQPQYTQYMDNMLYYNPAYAGSRDALSFAVLHRQQWTGFSGAPMTTSFTAHTPLKYKSFAVGISAINDKIGVTNANWVNADASWSMRFKNDSYLSFGLKGGVSILNGDIASKSKENVNDVVLNTNYRNELKVNGGGGIYYRSTNWFVGAAVPQLFESKYKPGDVIAFNKRHYYFMVGGYFSINSSLKLRPSAMVKVTENAPVAIDASAALIIKDKLWLGANYRFGDSFGAIVQLQFTKQFKLGYGLDISMTKLRSYNYGTHEILLMYDLVFNKSMMSSPRYF